MSGRLAVAAVLLANVAELAKTDLGSASKSARPAFLPIFPLHPSVSPSLRPPAAVAALRGGGSRCSADRLCVGTHAAASKSIPVSVAARSLPQPPEVGRECEQPHSNRSSSECTDRTQSARADDSGMERAGRFEKDPGA